MAVGGSVRKKTTPSCAGRSYALVLQQKVVRRPEACQGVLQ